MRGAVQLFNMCSYLAPDKIPVDMFIRGKDALPGILKQGIVDDTKRDEMLKDLTKYSLLLYEEKKCTFNMHRLLQWVVQKSFGTDYIWLDHCFDLMHKIAKWNKNIRESVNFLSKKCLM